MGSVEAVAGEKVKVDGCISIDAVSEIGTVISLVETCLETLVFARVLGTNPMVRRDASRCLNLIVVVSNEIVILEATVLSIKGMGTQCL